MNAYQALNAYRKTDTLSEVESASPHRLIQIVLQRAIEQIHRARVATDAVTQRDAMSRAIGLVDLLSNSLSNENENPIVDNLAQLYTYILDQLLSGSRTHDPQSLAQSAGLLETVKTAWDQVPGLVGQQADVPEAVKGRLHAI